jgi:deoxyribonuclease-4
MSSAALLVGAHCSTGGHGLSVAVRTAQQIGANALALFVTNQRTWSQRSTLSATQCDDFQKALRDACIENKSVLVHGSYLVNLASPDAEKLAKSRAHFLFELRRCEQLQLPLYNFHPGSAMGAPRTEAIRRIADSINAALSATSSVVAVLENVAGQGTNVGSSFEELREIIDLVDDKSRVGVCIDVCHAHSAGYSMASTSDCEATFAQFERVIGFDKLRGMHLNDSKTPFASRKDRHENLGRGSIGEPCFAFVANDRRFRGIPLILETPVESDAECAREIEWFRALANRGSEHQGGTDATGISL